MRKAFDANVPKLKPRLRAGAGPAPLPADAADVPEGTADAGAPAVDVAVLDAATDVAPGTSQAAATPAATTATATPTSHRTETPHAPAAAPGIPAAAPASAGPPAAAAPENDVLSRKDRLDKIKRKVAEASRPKPRLHPVPADPALAAESVLALVGDLEAELLRAREREEALRGDLDEVRKDLSRAAAEGRGAAERLAACEVELEEKRSVLGEMLAEMQALEEERDESVRRAQALAALDEERARLLEELGRRADEEGRVRAEREAEVERLSEELRLAGADGARLRAAVGELARERDQLASDLDRAREERDQLGEAKRALEQVHAALAQARARLG